MNRTFRLTSTDKVNEAIKAMRSVGFDETHVVRIEPEKKDKTYPQLKTVHMWIKEVQQMFQESHGKYYTDEDLKYWFKSLFGIVEIYETPNGKRKRYKSFADYTAEEMSTFMDTMSHYCLTELELFLTLPGYED